MIKERKTGPFRGATGMLKLVWWWDLLWVAICVWTYAVLDSGFNGIMAVVFLVLWVMAEILRVRSNQLYDKETELLDRLAKISRSETRLW